MKYVLRDTGHSSWHCQATIFNTRTRKNWAKTGQTQQEGSQMGREHFCPGLRQGSGVIPQMSRGYAFVADLVCLCILHEDLVAFALS